jgi:hypothetical protein
MFNIPSFMGFDAAGFAPPIDPDAAAFFARVTSAGGTLSATEQTAVNTLVVTMKADGTWTPMKAIYPMVGASAAACAQNLKSSSFTGTFSSGWTFASTGVTGNGITAFMDSNFNPITQSQAQNNTFLSVYVRNNVISATPYDMGSSASFSGAANPTFLITRYGGNVFYLGISDVSFACSGASTDSRGLWAGGTNSSLSQILYRNGVSIKSSTTAANAFANFNLFLAATNNIGTANFFSNKEYALCTISDGLNATQAGNFYTAVQTFNQTLNRQVGAQIVSDADAQAYINRVYTAGGTLTNTEANAVNQLTIDMKAAGIWTAMKAVYPMVGSSAAACAQNLKSSSFTGTFTSGWTFASTGVTPNGTSAYMDTALNQSTVLSNDSCHLSFYSRTNAIVNNSFEIGGYVSPYGALLACSYASLGSLSHLYSYPTDTAQSNSFENSQAFYIANRSSQTSNKIIRNSTVLTTNTTSRTSTLANSNIYIAASSPTTQFSSRQCAFASIGDGLTDTQAASLYTCVQTMNTTLSRNV